jgi:hypothetical protein
MPARNAGAKLASVSVNANTLRSRRTTGAAGYGVVHRGYARPRDADLIARPARHHRQHRFAHLFVNPHRAPPQLDHQGREGC